ncbi:MAG: HEAT repeat domain-containing protein, partial [Moorea sp. SIO4G2]|nr:HEAT repeat domain-containing protein [Moorena sp. SIO4G2]
DSDSMVRRKAIEQLAQGYKDDRDTLALLQEWARCDQDWQVRSTAIVNLAQGWPDHPDALRLLQKWARSDSDSMVRHTAIKQLAQGWKEQPWLFEFLCDRTLHDPFERKESWSENPRQVALKAILNYYPNHSQTRSLLQDRAEHDSDPELRKFAQKNLE